MMKKPPPALYRMWLAKGAAQMMKKLAITIVTTPRSIRTVQKPR